MLEGSLRQDLEVAVLIALGPQTQGLVTILAYLNAEIEIGENVLDQYLCPEYYFFIFGAALFMCAHEVALLFESKLTLGRGLFGEMESVVDEATWSDGYPLVNR